MVPEVRRLMASKTLSSNDSLRVQYGGCHCFSTFFAFMGVHWRSSAVETQYEGTGRFTLAARLIGSTGRLTPAARLLVVPAGLHRPLA
jgi:hypothetical protein